MSDDFKDHIAPVSGTSPIDRLEGHSRSVTRLKSTQSISGRIVAVHRRPVHRDGEHQLDVTVGSEEIGTEIVVRVPDGAYGHLEGKKVVLHIDESE